MSKLLFDEQPLVVDRTLAKLIGLNEAIVLQQVHYWITINQKAKKNFHEGRYWTYNTMKSWQEENFEFWSFNTVQRTFYKLESLNLLITDNFNKDPRDKTKWYSINYEVLETLKNANTPKWDEQKTLKTPITPKWGDALTQNGVMHNSKMGRALPETSTENTSEISKISQSVNKKVDKKNQPIQEKTDGQTDYKKIKVLFQDKLKFNNLKISHPTAKQLVDEIELNILEMYNNNYTIIQGQKQPQEIVRNALFKLTHWHLDTLIFKYIEKSSTTKIMNPKAYIQAMIYNIAFEQELALTNDIRYRGFV